MLIAAAPVAVPVSTANPPTESVAAEAAQKTPIPEPKSTTESNPSRNSTEFADQQRNNVEPNSQNAQRDRVDKDGDQSGQSRQEQEAKQQSQQEKQQADQERRQVEELKRTDTEVRAHERAHAAVGGQLAGAPSYTFTTGPDGKRYAVAGEVSIDTSKVAGNPQATIDKMQQVQRAALAPADPSSQDLRVAAIAGQIANQARVELNIQRREETQATGESTESETGVSSLDSEPNDSGINFANPVSARRASLNLNQRIVSSGALDDADQAPLLSQTA